MDFLQMRGSPTPFDYGYPAMREETRLENERRDFDADTALKAAAVVRDAMRALRQLPPISSWDRGVCCPHDLATDLEEWAAGFDHTNKTLGGY